MRERKWEREQKKRKRVNEGKRVCILRSFCPGEERKAKSEREKARKKQEEGRKPLPSVGWVCPSKVGCSE